MITVGSFEAKTNLSRLLDQVANGEEVTITKRGTPVARIVPIVSLNEDTAETIARLRRLAKNVSLRGLSVKEMIEEGRK